MRVVRRDGEEESIPIKHGNLYERSVARFNAAVRGEGEPAATGEDGVRSLASHRDCMNRPVLAAVGRVETNHGRNAAFARALDVGRRHLGKGKARVVVSVSTHVPKPHTPFQWCAMDDRATVLRKQAILKDTARGTRVDLRVHGSEGSMIEGVLALVAFLVLGSLIAWVPVAALAGILIVIGIRMIDLHSLSYLRSRSTVLDFVVIASVVATALTVSLIAASGVGIVLAVLLFVREEIGGMVVRRKRYGNESFSRQMRLHDEMEILLERGREAVIFELQGSLFFGTADQIYTALERDLARCRYVTLDLRRVQALDITAAHVLNQLKDILAEHGGQLLLSQIPKKLPNGKDVRRYLDEVGLLGPDSPVRVFGELDEAVEWVEDRILEQVAMERREEEALALHEFEVFRGRKEATLAALEARMEKRLVPAGQKIFSRGDAGDELLLIRRGAVRIVLPLSDRQSHHLGTFGRGAFFGEMAFLDGEPRSANAVAFADCELYVISRRAFDKFAEDHRKLGLRLMEGIASVLASRLRYTNAELRVLES